MSTDKIQGRIDEIILEYYNRIEALLSICESEIEKIYLLDFIRFFTCQHVADWEYSFDGDMPDYGERINYTPIRKDSSLRLWPPPFVIDRITFRHNVHGVHFSIIPQFEIKVSEKQTFRVDFAIVGECFEADQNSFKDVKVIIECDGHEFHKTPDQIKKDNERANKMKAQGWVEFRYSGRTIYGENFNAAKDFENYLIEVLNAKNFGNTIRLENPFQKD
ncbi:hypothetical protein [Phnomibacter sp. MR]|uniref:hypothetical protein n=1 Tax=Phnomibacter sp. MR TaxID=3042318 RepID=UPI003A7F883E